MRDMSIKQINIFLKYFNFFTYDDYSRRHKFYGSSACDFLGVSTHEPYQREK